MRERTHEHLQEAVTILSVLAHPEALLIVRALLDHTITLTYDGLMEETGLSLEQVREHVARLFDVGIVIAHDSPVFQNSQAGFAYMKSDMPVLAEAIIESLWGDLILVYDSRYRVSR